MIPTCRGSYASLGAASAAVAWGALSGLFDPSGFPARWRCWRWPPGLGWLHVTSDLATFGASLAIPATLGYFLVRRGGLPFPRMVALFGLFTLSCGIGHALEALIFRHPADRLAGAVKVVAAAASWATVVALVRALPEALELPRIAQLVETLRREEAEARKLALVASRTDNAVILTDARGRIEWVNDGFSRVCGYTLEEVVGRTPGSFLHGPKTDPALVATMREHLGRGEGFQVEVINYAKDGGDYWVAIEVQPIRDEGGRISGFISIEADITGRKRAEQALVAAHRERSEIMEAVPHLIYVLDHAGRLVHWNRRIESVTGLSPAELAGREAVDFFPRSQHAIITEAIRRSFEEGYAEAEADLIVADGSTIPHHFATSPMRDASGRVTGLAGMGIDLRERKQIEQEMRLLKAAVEHANDVVLITEAVPSREPGPRIVYANPALAEVTGFAPEEVIGKTPRLFQGPETDRDALDALRRDLEAWRPSRAELLNYRKDGGEFWVELTLRPVADASGSFTHWVSIQRDVTARKRTEQAREWVEHQVRDLNARLEQRVRRLDSLRKIDLAISASADLRLTLEIVLEQILAQLRVDAAAVLLAGPHDPTLTYAAGLGFRTDAIAETRLRPGEGYAGRAALERRPVSEPDLLRPESPFLRARLVEGEGFVSYRAVPLVAKGQVRGVLEVFHRGPHEADRDWIEFLEALAAQAAIAVDNATLFGDLQRSHAELVSAYDATIEGWAAALDLRDKETEGHTRRVTETAVRLARAMGVAEAQIVHVRRGALLHDIGKLGIPDAILLKPGPLDAGEMAVMRRHPAYAREWLAPIEFLRPALDIPLGHHEKWDGTGYPLGLAGERIPLAARIFAAVDIWDALLSDRPYRAGWPAARVVEHIRSLSGTHLDPAVVAAFLRLLAEDDAAARPARAAPAPARPRQDQVRRALASMGQLGTRWGEYVLESSQAQG